MEHADGARPAARRYPSLRCHMIAGTRPAARISFVSRFIKRAFHRAARLLAADTDRQTDRQIDRQTDTHTGCAPFIQQAGPYSLVRT
jgi:hypothetical protein